MRKILLWLLPLALVACAEKEKEPEKKPEPEKEKDALVITTSELTASPEGQEWQLALQANVTVKATTDVDWIEVTPPSKAMVEKQFSVRVPANDSGATRVGNITFTAGEVSQRVKVSQEALPPPPPPAEYIPILHADDLAAGDELLLNLILHWLASTPFSHHVHLPSGSSATYDIRFVICASASSASATPGHELRLVGITHT